MKQKNPVPLSSAVPKFLGGEFPVLYQEHSLEGIGWGFVSLIVLSPCVHLPSAILAALSL